MRIATVEVKVPRHSSANSSNPIKHHVRVRCTDQLECTILGNPDFNLGAFPELKRLSDRSRYPNRQTVSPLGNLHATNLNICRRTNVYLPAKAIQAFRATCTARRAEQGFGPCVRASRACRQCASRSVSGINLRDVRTNRNDQPRLFHHTVSRQGASRRQYPSRSVNTAKLPHGRHSTSALISVGGTWLELRCNSAGNRDAGRVVVKSGAPHLRSPRLLRIIGFRGTSWRTLTEPWAVQHVEGQRKYRR